MNAFLMTYWTFTTAQRLLEMLLDQFHFKAPEGLSDVEYKDWKANLQIPTQRRILDVITTWIEEYHLLDEPGVSRQLTDFLTHIVAPPHATRAAQLVKIINQLVCIPHSFCPLHAFKLFAATIVRHFPNESYYDRLSEEGPENQAS